MKRCACGEAPALCFLRPKARLCRRCHADRMARIVLRAERDWLQAVQAGTAAPGKRVVQIDHHDVHVLVAGGVVIQDGRLAMSKGAVKVEHIEPSKGACIRIKAEAAPRAPGWRGKLRQQKRRRG